MRYQKRFSSDQKLEIDFRFSTEDAYAIPTGTVVYALTLTKKCYQLAVIRKDILISNIPSFLVFFLSPLFPLSLVKSPSWISN